MRWINEPGDRETRKFKYQCELCNCVFAKKKNYDQHLAGQQHRTNQESIDTTWAHFAECASMWGEKVVNHGDSFEVDGESVSMLDVVRAWSPEELERFPMRATCLSPRTFFADLPLVSKARLWKYIYEIMPYNGAELPAILFGVGVEEPKVFRVKEVVEACESFKLMENFLVSARRLRKVSLVVDAACGHGLLGVLLAYRFPELQVEGVDIVEREALAAWRRGWEARGSKLAHWPRPLHNYRFRHGDVAALHKPDALGPQVCVVALHGCNEVTRECIEAAGAGGALWAVMPCCVPADIYLEGCSLRLPDGGALAGDPRHAFLCGVIAARYGAQMVAHVDQRITNRALLLAGGCSELQQDQKLGGMGRGVRKVAPAKKS